MLTGLLAQTGGLMSASKAKFCVELAVEELVKRSIRKGLRPIMSTVGFAENLTDKEEAERRWKLLRQRIERRYPNIVGVHTWQTQKRGAWHIHAVWSNFVDVNWLRAAALECGFGPQMKLRFIDCQYGGFDSVSIRDVCRYITRYISRDFRERVDGRHKLIGYVGRSRAGFLCQNNFHWANGLSRLYRLGQASWLEMGLSEFIDGQLYEQGFWFVCRLGWESLSHEEQDRLLQVDKAVCRWFYAVDDPF